MKITTLRSWAIPIQGIEEVFGFSIGFLVSLNCSLVDYNLTTEALSVFGEGIALD
jgi:hypothetical protein